MRVKIVAGIFSCEGLKHNNQYITRGMNINILPFGKRVQVFLRNPVFSFRKFPGIALLCVSLVLGASTVQAFELKTLNEEVVDLLDYVHDDHWTLVMFWATDCVECERQKPAFEAFHQKYQNNLVSALGVAVDGVEHKALIEDKIELHKPSYPNLMAYSDVYERQFEELAGKPFFGSPRYLLFAPGGQLAAQFIVKIDFEEVAEKIASLKQ